MGLLSVGNQPRGSWNVKSFEGKVEQRARREQVEESDNGPLAGSILHPTPKHKQAY